MPFGAPVWLTDTPVATTVTTEPRPRRELEKSVLVLRSLQMDPPSALIVPQITRKA